MTSLLDETRTRLADAGRVLVITGAGISAESGIRTFRGREGWWKNNDPMTLASPDGFARDPALVWEWYLHRIEGALAAEPNAGHRALVELEQREDAFCLLTQNVDGLHQRAGSLAVHQIHGSILRARGTESGRLYDVRKLDRNAPPPLRAPDGELLRPDVVWFGEIIREEAYMAVENFLQEGAPDVTLLVGTTSMFAYIQRWAVLSKQLGAYTAEINPEPTELSSYLDASIKMRAGEALPALIASS